MTNQRTVDLVVCFMGVMGIGAIAAAVYLAAVNQSIPDPLWGISGGVIVGLPSLLASLRTTESPPVPVIGPDGGPVPVEEGGHADVTLVLLAVMCAAVVALAYDLIVNH